MLLSCKVTILFISCTFAYYDIYWDIGIYNTDECYPFYYLLDPNFLNENDLVYATWINATFPTENSIYWNLALYSKHGKFIAPQPFAYSPKYYTNMAGKIILTKEEDVHVFFFNHSLYLKGVKYSVRYKTSRKGKKKYFWLSEEHKMKNRTELFYERGYSFNLYDLLTVSHEDFFDGKTFFLDTFRQYNEPYCDYILQGEDDFHNVKTVCDKILENRDCNKNGEACLMDVASSKTKIVPLIKNAHLPRTEPLYHDFIKCNLFLQYKITTGPKVVRYNGSVHHIYERLYVFNLNQLSDRVTPEACFDLPENYRYGVLWKTTWVPSKKIKRDCKLGSVPFITGALTISGLLTMIAVALVCVERRGNVIKLKTIERVNQQLGETSAAATAPSQLQTTSKF